MRVSGQAQNVEQWSGDLRKTRVFYLHDNFFAADSWYTARYVIMNVLISTTAAAETAEYNTSGVISDKLVS